MRTSSRPFTVKERKELKEQVSWTPGMIILSLAIAGLVLKLAHFLHGKLSASFPFFQPAYWWIGPCILLFGFLYWNAEHSRSGARSKRADLNKGEATIYRVEAVDVIEVEEQEDEGPSFFVKTSDGETILFRGQHLDRYKRKGFPWKSFEIVEAPRSKYFLGFNKIGEPLQPGISREPFTWAEMKDFGFENFCVVETDFDQLKAQSGQHSKAPGQK